MDVILRKRQRIGANGLHGAAHLAHGVRAAVEHAAALFFVQPAHHGAQAAVVIQRHHGGLGLLCHLLGHGLPVFVQHALAVLIVYIGRCLHAAAREEPTVA